MQIDIHAHGLPLTPGVREHVEQRLRFALGRFSGSIARVAVSLADASGPRGGPDKECRIQVSLPPTVVLIKDVGGDLETVVDRAANRASRSASRELDRRRTRWHSTSSENR